MESRYITSKPDPRALGIQIIEVIFLCFYLGRIFELMVVFGFVALLLVYHKLYTKAFYHFRWYVILILIYLLLNAYPVPLISELYAMIFSLYIKLVPIYLSCSLLLEKVPMNQLITAMQKLKIPFDLIIPISIVYRYIPTIREEIHYILNSMKTRGIRITPLYFIRHPMESVECCMVPLLIRSGKISDELSAASICKGLDSETDRTSVVDVRLDRADIVYMGLSMIFAILIVYVHHANILR